MSDEVRVVYGFCQDNCKHPVYTKEEVIGLLQYVIEHNELPPDIVDGNYDSTQGLVAVNSVVEQNKGKAINFFVGTQAEYDAYTGDKKNLFAVITDDTTKQDILDTLKQHAVSINKIISGDIIIPRKKPLWSGCVELLDGLRPVAAIPNLQGKTIEFKLGAEQQSNGGWGHRESVRVTIGDGVSDFGKYLLGVPKIENNDIKWEQFGYMYIATDVLNLGYEEGEIQLMASKNASIGGAAGESRYIYAIYEIIE